MQFAEAKWAKAELAVAKLAEARLIQTELNEIKFDFTPAVPLVRGPPEKLQHATTPALTGRWWREQRGRQRAKPTGQPAVAVQLKGLPFYFHE